MADVNSHLRKIIRGTCWEGNSGGWIFGLLSRCVCGVLVRGWNGFFPGGSGFSPPVLVDVVLLSVRQFVNAERNQGGCSMDGYASVALTVMIMDIGVTAQRYRGIDWDLSS